MVEESFSMQMVTHTLATSKTIRLMVMENTFIMNSNKNTLVNGKMICNMGKVVRSLVITQYTKEPSKKEESTDKESMCGQMDLVLKDSGKTMRCVVMVFLSQQIRGSMSDFIKTVNLTERVCTNGLMAEITKAITKMIRRKASEFTTGLMAKNIKVSGEMVCKKVLDSSKTQKGRLKLVSGNKVSVWPGSKIKRNLRLLAT